VLIVIALVASAALGALMGRMHSAGMSVAESVHEVLGPPFGGKDTVRILVLGEDDSNARRKKQQPHGLSDTMMLLNVNLSTNSMAVLSIPRDTKADIPDHGTRKINSANVLGGPQLASVMAEQVTGLKPDYYIETNLEAFRKCVDILGGVDMYVEKNMHYNDNWGNLHINLKKGYQHLNGEKAMEYIRFRHDKMGDIWRVERQQKFIKVIAMKALSPANLPRLPRIVAAVKENVDTDMDVKDLMTLAMLPKKVDLNKVKTGTLPGLPQRIGGASYWVADPAKSAKLIQDLFFTQEIPGLPKVEVLNGSGTSGAAQKVADILKQQGYVVTAVGNAGSFRYASSQVVSHKDGLKGVDKIATALKVANIRQDKKPSTSKADVTVIVGQDFAAMLKT
jgi:LCP family protein required for cell wall assembly